MSDLIDRKQVLDAIREWADSEDCVPIAVGVRTAARIVESAPAVDAVPAVHGHWVDCCWYYLCSKCSWGTMIDSNYCPDCGAKMEGMDEEAGG